MGYDSSEVFNTYTDVQFILNSKFFEVHGVNGYGRLEGLFEDF